MGAANLGARELPDVQAGQQGRSSGQLTQKNSCFGPSLLPRIRNGTKKFVFILTDFLATGILTRILICPNT